MNKQESGFHDFASDGGLLVRWLLADTPSTFTTKKGEVKTVIELRDPARLGKSLVIWLDGDGEALQGVALNSCVTLRVDAVRSGRARGELVAEVSREAVEAAFAAAGDVS